jgi:hypothetical protein
MISWCFCLLSLLFMAPVITPTTTTTMARNTKASKVLKSATSPLTLTLPSVVILGPEADESAPLSPLAILSSYPPPPPLPHDNSYTNSSKTTLPNNYEDENKDKDRDRVKGPRMS